MATRIHHFGDSFHFPSIAGFGATLRDGLARFNAYRRDRHNQAMILSHLASADERELRDLNISRYDIGAIAHGTFKR